LPSRSSTRGGAFDGAVISVTAVAVLARIIHAAYRATGLRVV
jgi:hypothetical protein